MKKFAKVLSAFVLTSALLTGCGSSETSDQSVKMGMITSLNASEQKIDEVLKLASEKSGLKLVPHTTTFYKNLSTMQMGLESGSVNEISTYESVAKYLLAKNPKMELVPQHVMSLSDSFCFAMRKSDESLKKDIDKAINAMKKDGTLDKLVKQYITDANADDPPAVEMPKFDGAETLKVAVTGDLPPLDLVLADGKPAGFNTALIAELAKRINRNIEIIDIDGDARASALSSNRADVIFWAIIPVGDDRAKDIDTPEDAILSEPYFTDKITHIKIKN